MPKIVSVHEYMLKPNVSSARFEKAIILARDRGLLQLPGLETCHLLKGIKGVRRGHYTAVWVYESREAWEKLWGTPEHPLGEEDYPDNWVVWEQEVLAPFLDRAPDTVVYSAYEEISDNQ